MDKKRIIYITIFIIVCILLGLAIYFVFFKKISNNNNTGTSNNTSTNTDSTSFPNNNNGNNTSGNVTNNSNTGGNTTPTNNNLSNTINNNNLDTRFNTTQEKPLVNKITSLESTNITPTSDGGLKFYNKQDGKFYKVGANGLISPLGDQVFYNVSKVSWAPNGNDAIIEYPDGANTYYNFDSKKQITLPTHWEDFSFSADGSEIAAKSIGLDPSNRWLITSDTKGQNVKLIESMGNNADKVIVDWSPNRQILALSATGDALGADQQQILPIGLNQENYKGLVVQGRGLETEWSPDGSKLLHSVYSNASDYKPELWIVDATPDTMGNNRKPLGINTWASKCTVVDNRFVYCGVPTSMETGTGFTPQISDVIADDIYKIDMQTGVKTVIPTDGFHTVDSMYTSTDGTKLYFTDKNNNGIFEIPIK